MTLHVWRSERADGLLRPLADVLAHPPADPFTPEVIAVPTAGIERWVTQELSLVLGTAGAGTTDGVCANVDFPFPGALVARALEAAAGLPEDHDPWRPDHLVWTLLGLHEREPDPALWGPAAAHLGSGDDGRRYVAARHLADLFDRYAVHRPEMVRAWAAGQDDGPDLAPIAASHAWQATLWRTVRAQLDLPSTAERLADAARRLADGDVDLGLPDRLSLFGLSSLASSYLEVLLAMAGPREVHLFLRHPSPALWDRLEEGAETQPLRRTPRADDPTAETAAHPLLRSWGRDAREMQLVFADLGAPSAQHVPASSGAPTTVLARLQGDVHDDRRPPGRPVDGAEDHRAVFDPEDRSIQVHASHGRLRQVQVLRDTILHLLAGDPQLEPRDIIVMCPDVESFAPYVDAVFGAHVAASDAPTDRDPDADGNGDGAHRDTPALRVRIADRSLRQTNPVLKVVAELLDLADDRLTGPQVLDLLSRTPVRRRFGFSDDDLGRLESWIPELGIRWGLDGDDRARYDLGGLEANTWRFGIQRLLAGVAVADEDQRVVAGVVPYDDVEGSDVDLAGRFAECVARLSTALGDLRTARPLRDWARVLREVAAALTASDGRDAWQEVQLDRLLDSLVDQAGDTADEVALSLADARAMLGDRLRGRPSRASHRTGDLTVSTLVPMRAVPHKVVCLLGMDDGSFPRRTVPDGDDLVDLVPYVGDRDPRTEDRQLLLDALLSATDHLVITYSGRDERTNEPLPPAVPVGELLDVVDATVRAADGPARERIVTEHPLQPFDPRNYIDGTLGPAGPWSFDRVGLAGARALGDGPRAVPPFLTDPLPAREEDREVVDLGQLIRFLEHPVRFFLSERLGVWLREDGDAPPDGIPLDLTGLPKWSIGDRLLTALRSGATREAWERVERARGTLPPEPLATAVLDEVCPLVERLLGVASDELGDVPAVNHPVDLLLPDGRRLLGSIGEVHDEVIGLVTYSSLKAKQRIASYARLVALTATQPEVAWRAVLVGRVSGSRNTKPVEVCQLAPLGDDPEGRRTSALAALQRLLDLYDRGGREPVPLYGNTSYAIAASDHAGKGPWAASKTWETSYGRFTNDDRDPCHVAALGRISTFDELMAPPYDPNEAGEDWDACEQRVVTWARRLWDPVLDLATESRR